MMPRFASKAEYYRHHRAIFTLALELGVTPAEAEIEARRREARAKAGARRERLDRMLSRHAAAHLAEPATRPFENFDCPYMMRN